MSVTKEFEPLRQQSCCFTGHRDLPTAQDERRALAARLRETLESLIAQGVCYFGAGGARGFDTLAAQTVLQLKAQHPHIRLILILPCKDQTRGWDSADLAAYNEVLAAADKVVWLAERYYHGCMHVRNRRLVDNAAVCVCYLKKYIGGTAYTVRYAAEQQLTVLNIAP